MNFRCAAVLAPSQWLIVVFLCLSADAVSGSPTAGTQPETDFLANSRRAFARYLEAAEAGDGAALSRILTEDASLEYITRGPGLYLDSDGTNFGAECTQEAARLGLRRRFFIVSVIRPDATNEVFIQYEAVTRRRDERLVRMHIAMIAMRGMRISGIRSFGEPCTSSAYF